MIGIYLLMMGNDVVYVGQSVNIDRRIKEHKQEKKKEFDSFFPMPCDISNLDSSEAMLILVHNPKYNKQKYEISVNVKKKQISKGKQINLSKELYNKITKEAKKLDMPRTQFLHMLMLNFKYKLKQKKKEK